MSNILIPEGTSIIPTKANIIYDKDFDVFVLSVTDRLTSNSYNIIIGGKQDICVFIRIFHSSLEGSLHDK